MSLKNYSRKPTTLCRKERITLLNPPLVALALGDNFLAILSGNTLIIVILHSRRLEYAIISARYLVLRSLDSLSYLVLVFSGFTMVLLSVCWFGSQGFPFARCFCSEMIRLNETSPDGKSAICHGFLSLLEEDQQKLIF